MPSKTIRYGRLWSFGTFENERIEIEDNFPDIKMDRDCLEELVKRVSELHNVSEDLRYQERVEAEKQREQRYIEQQRRARADDLKREITSIDAQLARATDDVPRLQELKARYEAELKEAEA